MNVTRGIIYFASTVELAAAAAIIIIIIIIIAIVVVVVVVIIIIIIIIIITITIIIHFPTILGCLVSVSTLMCCIHIFPNLLSPLITWFPQWAFI
jgi:hypothetical protein